MVFYAYVKWATNQDIYRYLLTAESFNVIDEWWREVAGKNLNFQRSTPEWYTFTNVHPQTTLTTASQAPQFQNKIQVTLLNDLGGRVFTGVPPNQRFTDHVSGNSFYIRSKSNPQLYWYLTNGTGAVYLSTQGRTRFRITAKDKNISAPILIGTDQVTVAVATQARVFISVDAAGSVIGGAASASLTFGELLSGSYLGDGFAQNLKVIQSDAGEDWELVS